MATCPSCELDMATAPGCTNPEPHTTRYSYDADVDWYRADAALRPARCRDCGVIKGAVHHPGCCVAGCTRCKGQKLMCECDDHPGPLSAA
jgi:hypothetical protein